MGPTADFYDKLAPFFHLIFEDWQSSIARQATALDSIIRSAVGPYAHSVLDVACGIGTQAIGLAARGYCVTASDISGGAVQRARLESNQRNLTIEFSVADMRAAYSHHKQTFDIVLCADNSLPHLLTDQEILQALEQFLACTKPGGLCIISVRDYAATERGGTQIRLHGVRLEGRTRNVLFQVWMWHGALYDLDFYVVQDEGNDECQTHVMRSTYYAITISELMALMTRAGFMNVQRHDNVFFQPVLTGMRPSEGS
jgi:SAM-dependent methyltransferase